MSNNKSGIAGIIAVCVAVIFGLGRFVKSCGRVSTKSIDLIDGASNLKGLKGVGKSTLNGLDNLSNLHDFSTAFDLFTGDQSIEEVNTLFYESKLSQYFTESTFDSLYLDSLYSFIDLEFYIPNIYKVKPSSNNKNAIEWYNDAEHITLIKTFYLPSNNKFKSWSTNKKGVKYKRSEIEYDDHELVCIYHLSTANNLYKIQYTREMDIRKDFATKYLFRTEALIHLMRYNKQALLN